MGDTDRIHKLSRPGEAAGAGAPGTDPIRGWYRHLTTQLQRLEPYLAAGRIVTFRHLLPEERDFFAHLSGTLRVPAAVCAVFIPPSVVQQALWPGATAAGGESALYGVSPDAGAVAAHREGSLSTVVNALFAFPPMSPGVDVYEEGRLLAGYTYRNHQECSEGLSEVLATYLR